MIAQVRRDELSSPAHTVERLQNAYSCAHGWPSRPTFEPENCVSRVIQEPRASILADCSLFAALLLGEL